MPPLETPSDARSASGLYDPKTRKLFDPKDPATAVDPGRLAFGQERMLVTPLQMAMVAAGIANKGVVMTPRAHQGGALARAAAWSRRLHPRKYSQATKPKTAAASAT